jgi:translation initiation factor 2-alpha kinase 4
LIIRYFARWFEDEDDLRYKNSNMMKAIQKMKKIKMMECCEKKTLRDVIDEEIDKQEACHLLRQLLEGLLHIHSQSMIHRDLKSHTIFLN